MRIVLVTLILLAAQGTSAQTPAARAAVMRALPVLQRSADVFVRERACVSCHHNVLPIMALRLARERGVPVDQGILRTVEDRTFRELRGTDALDEAIQGVNLSDPTPNDSFLLMAAGAAGHPRDLVTEVYARRLIAWQREDHWKTSDFRPPHSSSTFTATATAVRAIRLYAPPELEAEARSAIGRATSWLTGAKTESTEDAAFRLLGLVWADAPERARALARGDLESRQTADGGWPQLSASRATGAGSAESDAYSTGQALVALHTAGTPTDDRRWQRGLTFLLRTQARDGTWRVRTRMKSPATVSPPYFDVAFPYQKDAFISYAGTAWAVMALLSVVPPQPSAPSPQISAALPFPPWLRTALFSPVTDLERLLDAGLSPQSATPGGTPLLMASATDPAKVALLLERGADPATRAPSGVDALTVAASYRGTSASVRRLLAAGAPPAPPAGVRVTHTPLALASMSGDLETATELLARGAAPSAVGLAESITFDNPHITRLLLERGADASIEERTGVTLLHWAVITNRPDAIPLLVAAGLDVNRKDSFGFTPLMYAATINQGHTRLIGALLAAGADRGVRNHEGRTAQEQARHLGHDALADALR